MQGLSIPKRISATPSAPGASRMGQHTTRSMRPLWMKLPCPTIFRKSIIEAVAWRTPGYSAWQSEHWFSCCNDAMTFIEPVGIREIRERYRELEFSILGNIIYDRHISGSSETANAGVARQAIRSNCLCFSVQPLREEQDLRGTGSSTLGRHREEEFIEPIRLGRSAAR